MKEVLASLLVWIANNSAYDAPEQLPQLEFQAAAAFAEQACPRRANCAARGYYHDGTGRIVVHEAYRGLTSVQERALVVHELVHYLQDLSGRYGGEKTCEIWLEREREAFRLQIRYTIENTRGNILIPNTPKLSREQCERVRREEARREEARRR
ncbi:MAG: hypothetical protein ACR2RL_08925 [Gammaproteobacteria bacterium]